MRVEEYIPLRIKELCEKRGYTKYRLAQITRMTQTALGNILNQRSLPTIVNLERICDAFGITLIRQRLRIHCRYSMFQSVTILNNSGK